MVTDFSGARIRRAVIGAGLAWFAVGAAAVAQAATAADDPRYALARDAYLYAYPIVVMDATMRQATNVPDASAVPMRAPVNQFAHARAYPDANAKDDG